MSIVNFSAIKSDINEYIRKNKPSEIHDIPVGLMKTIKLSLFPCIKYISFRGDNTEKINEYTSRLIHNYYKTNLSIEFFISKSFNIDDFNKMTQHIEIIDRLVVNFYSDSKYKIYKFQPNVQIDTFVYLSHGRSIKFELDSDKFVYIGKDDFAFDGMTINDEIQKVCTFESLPLLPYSKNKIKKFKLEYGKSKLTESFIRYRLNLFTMSVFSYISDSDNRIDERCLGIMIKNIVLDIGNEGHSVKLAQFQAAESIEIINADNSKILFKKVLSNLKRLVIRGKCVLTDLEYISDCLPNIEYIDLNGAETIEFQGLFENRALTITFKDSTKVMNQVKSDFDMKIQLLEIEKEKSLLDL